LIAAQDITALVLAGGRGSRMGGVDKGLQAFNGSPLVAHALQRLLGDASTPPQVGHVLINANRNLAQYAAFGAPVWPDAQDDFAGPLAGFLTGLAHCTTPYLLTVPCDTPLFPLDLAQRMAQALHAQQADIAMVGAPERNDAGEWQVRTQPVFCLLRRHLLASLQAFTQEGGRKIDAWTARHATVIVPFDRTGDDLRAFFNANTLADLRELETLRP
jgi:molybdopterin-guanine dinucleotide biosynthesis protein A